MLEGLCCIMQPKGREQELKQSEMYDYGSLGYVTWLYWDLVVGAAYVIQLTENSGTME